MHLIGDEFWQIAAILEALELCAIVEDKETVKRTLDAFIILL